jgi:hypothetical protein
MRGPRGPPPDRLPLPHFMNCAKDVPEPRIFADGAVQYTRCISRTDGTVFHFHQELLTVRLHFDDLKKCF